MFNKSKNFIRRENRENLHFSNQSFKILYPVRVIKVMIKYKISAQYV